MDYILYIEMYKLTLKYYNNNIYISIRLNKNLITRHLLSSNLLIYTNDINNWSQIQNISGISSFIDIIFNPLYNKDHQILNSSNLYKNFIYNLLYSIISDYIDKKYIGWLPDYGICYIYTEGNYMKLLSYQKSQKIEFILPLINDNDIFDIRNFFISYINTTNQLSSPRIKSIHILNDGSNIISSTKINLFPKSPHHNNSQLPDQQFLIFIPASPFKSSSDNIIKF